MTCVSSSLMPETNMFSLIVIFLSKEGFYADNVHCFPNFPVGKFFLLEVAQHILGDDVLYGCLWVYLGALDGFLCFKHSKLRGPVYFRIQNLIYFVEVRDSLTWWKAQQTKIKL